MAAVEPVSLNKRPYFALSSATELLARCWPSSPARPQELIHSARNHPAELGSASRRPDGSAKCPVCWTRPVRCQGDL